MDAIRRADARDLEGLTDLLIDVVEGGASVGFLLPIGREKARAFWTGALGSDARVVLVAEDDRGIVGTISLVLGLPENQPHRADVAKLQVHRRARGRGLGERLIRAIEDEARSRGKMLLVLDTVTGSDAERLYARLGWQRCGVIPGYALFPDGRPCSTTVMYRELRADAR